MDHPNFEDLRISATVLFFVTLAVTSYRCFARFSKKIWGHDDSVALFSSLIFVFFVIATSILARASLSRGERIIGSYLMMVGFYTPVWGGRISIVLTVYRVTPWQKQKRMLLCVVVFFVAQYLILLLQAFWVCEITRPEWKNIPGSICVLPEAVPITQMITTITSDGILIFTPLMIIRGVRIPALRSRLFRIFSVSIVTTIASVTHAVMVMDRPGIMEAIFGCVEATVSVIVSSMSVIIPAILRALDVGDPFMQEDTVEPGFTTTVEIARMTLTRVELGLPTAHAINIAGRDDLEGVDGSIQTTKKRRDSVGLDERDDHKHRLTTQASDGSLGTSVTKIVSRTDECDVLGPQAFEVMSLPTVKKHRDVEGDAEGKNAKHQPS